MTSSMNCRAAPSISACQPERAMNSALALNNMKMLKVPAPKTKNANPMVRKVSQRRDSMVRWNQRFSISPVSFPDRGSQAQSDAPANSVYFRTLAALVGSAHRGAPLNSYMRPRVRLQKFLVLLALLSLPLTLLPGCSDGSRDAGQAGKRPVVLGFSQIVAKANWNAANTESIRGAA